jgi:hypothetical protein
MRDKLAKQVNALNRLTRMTWDFPLVRARQVYTVVIRPAASYAAAVWHQPKDIGRTYPKIK